MSFFDGYLYENLFKGMINGFAYCRAIYNSDGMMVDWIYVKVNPAFETQTGLKDVTGKSVSTVLPNLFITSPELFMRYELVAKGGPHQRFEHYITELGFWFDISVYSVEENTFTVAFENITRRKEIEAELTLANEEILMAFVSSLEFRDKMTEEHTMRVTELAVQMAEALGITGEDLVNVRRGALLHDIGKIGIPDVILLKKGRLTTEEYQIMKKHSQFAYDVLFPIKYLRPAIDIPYCHHEKWDGTGYPRGLKGEEIPLAARLFAVVDVYDALMSERPYRKPMPESLVIEHLQKRAGTNYDPAMVKIFLDILGNNNHSQDAQR